MGDNRDTSSNKKPELPTFELSKRGRIDMSFFRMDTGFLIIDQDSGKKSAVTNLGDVESTLSNASVSVIEEVRKVLNDASANDNIDVTIIVEKREIEWKAPQYEEGPAELGIEQLTQVVNDIIADNVSYGIPGMKRPGPMIDPMTINRYLQKMRVIRVKTEPQDFRGGKSTASDNVKGKGEGKNFYHDNSKNQNQNQNQGKSNPPEATKL